MCGVMLPLCQPRSGKPAARRLAEVEADAQPLALAGAGKHLVPQPAFPHQEHSGAGPDSDEAVRPRRRGHHQRQARVLETDRAGAFWNLDVERSGNDAVRVDVARVMAGGRQQVEPPAVELRVDRPTEIARDPPGVARQSARKRPEGGVALWKIVERHVAGIAGITMLLRPAAAGLVVLSEAADRMRKFGEQNAAADIRLVETCRKE